MPEDVVHNRLPTVSQRSFASAEYASKKKRTRREVFLEDVERVVPWPLSTSPAWLARAVTLAPLFESPCTGSTGLFRAPRAGQRRSVLGRLPAHTTDR